MGGFLLEIASLIWVGGRLGVVTTLLLVIAGAFIGTSLIRKSGLGLVSGLNAARGDTNAQMARAGRVFLLFLSGLLFISPGFFSDVVAALLLLLIVNIRNAWDLTLFMARKHTEAKQPPAP